jgi:hypothetical protein
MAEKGVKELCEEKAKEIAVLMCTVAADTVLLGVWLVGEFCFEHFLVPTFPTETIVGTTGVWIFRVLFAASTLIPCACNVYRNIFVVLLRVVADIRQTKKELAAKGMTASAGEGNTRAMTASAGVRKKAR